MRFATDRTAATA